MLPRTSIKFVPAEYHSQSAIAAAFEMRAEIGDPRGIRSIEIRTFKAAVEIIGQDPEKWRPKTRETADHSLPYCTVAALIDGEITARQFTHERLTDPALLDLVARTSVVEDPELTALYPEGIPNHVRVEMNDGRVVERLLSYPPGHDKNPLTDAQLREKFRGLVEPVLGPEAVERLYSKASKLADDPAPGTILGEITLAG
jgi:2-methylcitrate dehydratase